MTPLQKIAMGLVITLVDVLAAGYDIIPDVLGWVLVVLGLLELRDRITVTTLVPMSVLAGLVSLVGFLPDLLEDMPESTGWLISLPQIVVSYLLCVEVAGLVARPLSSRLRFLRWIFVAAAAGPVLVYGGGLDVTIVPLALLSVGANVYLAYALFRAAGEVHGPRRPSGAVDGHEDGGSSA